MKLLLENWREYVNEVTSLETDLKEVIFQSVLESGFWEHPNGPGNIDLKKDGLDRSMATPATEVLQDSLNTSIQNLNTDLYFSVSVADEEYALNPDDEYNGYPNNWMTMGQYRGPYKELNYQHVIWIELRPIGEDYNINDLDPNELAKKISTTINHELVHYEQLKKQAENKGLSDIDAYREMVHDEKQVTTSDDREVYLTRHGEIDAYAHEAAEQLVDTYGRPKALEAARKLLPVDIDKYPEISSVILDYADVLKNNPEELNKFRKKLYQQIQK
tara:strand:- start:2709 stop:3530 length:822 start_codon:yes stop_codon:yes gene_type:complete